MAFTPCAADGRGYAGGASTFFLRVVDGAAQTGGKLQFCPDHATLVVDYLARHTIKVSEGETFFPYTEPAVCMGCRNDLGDAQLRFYGNAYPRGHRESQWYGRVCSDCLDAVVDDLSLDRARVSA